MKYKTVKNITCGCGESYPENVMINSEYECTCGKRYVTKYVCGHVVIEPKQDQG